MSEFAFAILFTIAGFLDSIVGGGGLITVPAFTLILGPGAETIGTNKVVAFASTLTAVIVYRLNGHLKMRTALPFLITTLCGTVLGALAAPLLPKEAFRWALLFVCPIILYIVLFRDSLNFKIDLHIRNKRILLSALGLACGFYDGMFGPGAGTFMFLSLTWFAGIPLLAAIATSKLANFLSAAGSLGTYAAGGYVHWSLGIKFAVCALVGALLGSLLAHQRAQKIVKPILVIVILLLLIRIAGEL